MVREMTILTEFGNLHFSLKWKVILPKRKLPSSLCDVLAYTKHQYEQNRSFDPCHEIKNLSGFYRQAHLNIKIKFPRKPLYEYAPLGRRDYVK